MRRLFYVIFLLFPNLLSAASDLTAAVENVRAACGSISGDLERMKTMAGINTAVTSVGTVAGGVALGTGVAKASVDKEILEQKRQIDEILQSSGMIKLSSEDELLNVLGQMFEQTGTEFGRDVAMSVNARRDEIARLDAKSKTLGNVRTGTMATAAVTNIAGAVSAGTNRVQGDLKTRIDNCLITVKQLANVWGGARLAKSATDVELQQAEKIMRACNVWETVDVDAINKKSKGAAISSGVGAGLGLAGTITSASANSDRVRAGDVKKEQDLNTASNILAGGTTVASGAAVVFNATQIATIKRAAAIADECEGALK